MPAAAFSWKTPVANMAMRSASLGSRLLLSIYLARMVGLEAVGLFGIVSGIAGFAPSILGLGISYFVNRELITLPKLEAYRLIRDRISFSLFMAFLCWLLCIGLVAAGFLQPPPSFWVIAVIVTLEFLSFDLHIALINLQRPVTANFLLFMRSSSWIIPVIALGIFVPVLRTSAFMLQCWLVALVLNIAIIAFVFRDISLSDLWNHPIDWHHLLRRPRAAPLIYANDIAANGQVYLDRFIVLQLAGMSATGIYTLIFSVTHGIYVLVATAVTQLSMPKLVTALRLEGFAGWQRLFLMEGRRALTLAALVVVSAVIVLTGVLPRLGFDVFLQHFQLLGLMAITSLLKPASDLLNTGLYSLGLDNALALVNLGGVVLAVVLGIALVMAFGLNGIGVASITTLISVISIRSVIITRRAPRLTAGGPL